MRLIVRNHRVDLRMSHYETGQLGNILKEYIQKVGSSDPSVQKLATELAKFAGNIVKIR